MFCNEWVWDLGTGKRGFMFRNEWVWDLGT